MRKKTRRGLLAASIRAFFDLSRNDDMVRLEEVERLRVSVPRSQLVVSLDGEVVAATVPLDYRIRKRALRVSPLRFRRGLREQERVLSGSKERKKGVRVGDGSPWAIVGPDPSARTASRGDRDHPA